MRVIKELLVRFVHSSQKYIKNILFHLEEKCIDPCNIKFIITHLWIADYLHNPLKNCIFY